MMDHKQISLCSRKCATSSSMEMKSLFVEILSASFSHPRHKKPASLMSNNSIFQPIKGFASHLQVASLVKFASASRHQYRLASMFIQCDEFVSVSCLS